MFRFVVLPCFGLCTVGLPVPMYVRMYNACTVNQEFFNVVKHVHQLLSSWASVGRSKSANIYFLSHDIRHILYLVLLYDVIPFKLFRILQAYKSTLTPIGQILSLQVNSNSY